MHASSELNCWKLFPACVIEVLLGGQASTCRGSGVMTDGEQIESIWCLEELSDSWEKNRNLLRRYYTRVSSMEQIKLDICPGRSGFFFFFGFVYSFLQD